MAAGDRKTGDLPTLLPATPTPGFTLQRDGGDFVIRSETEFVTSWPQDQFLARWWVNDRPFVDPQLKDLPVRQRTGKVCEEKEIRLPVKLLLKRLGAKEDDTIGLQVTYCENDWSWCSNDHFENHAILSRDGAHARLSNRIDFKTSAK